MTELDEYIRKIAEQVTADLDASGVLVGTTISLETPIEDEVEESILKSIEAMSLTLPPGWSVEGVPEKPVAKTVDGKSLQSGFWSDMTRPRISILCAAAIALTAYAFAHSVLLGLLAAFGSWALWFCVGIAQAAKWRIEMLKNDKPNG